MIDRTLQPEAKSINKIDFVKPDTKKLDNGIPFHSLVSGSQPVLRLQFYFEAGTKFQNKSLQASFCARQLSEGTENFTSKQIADRLDYYGAFFQNDIDDRQSSLTLHCLTRNFKDVWPIVKEIITSPVFNENELKTSLVNGKQKLQSNLKKVEYIARRELLAQLFGEQHPYGLKTSEKDFDALNSDDLKQFYNQFYSAKNCFIMAAGNFDDEIYNIINKDLVFKNNKEVELIQPNLNVGKAIKVNIPKEEAVQCGIRIGKVLFNRTHPDYAGLSVVNTLFGGYFGSRLMSNIREDKGYTYGIGSALANFPDTGVFLIATEVGSEVCKDALHEIYFEMDRLSNELVDEEELELVKNYMMGSLLRNSDGPFAMADQFKMLQSFGLDYAYFDNFIRKINTITPKEIQELSKKYLDKNSFTEVVAGTLK